MKARTLVVLVLAAGLCACRSSSAPADEKAPPVNDKDISCSFSHPEVDAASLKQLPRPVREYIKSTIGEMADRGEFFNVGDAISRPAPFDRFIRGGTLKSTAGEKWFFWFEHGGIAYWKQIVVLSKNDSDSAELYSQKHAEFGSDLCAQTDAILVQ